MIIRRYFQWAQTASAGQRAEAASAMARSWLYADLSDDDFKAAGHALTALLDDASPLVRRSLAEALAGARDAPHHIIVALAHDQSDISAPVLSRSPVLSDAELIDCAVVGDAYAQSAIAIRPRLNAPVAAALAEIGQREALVALAINAGAEIPEFAMRRMLERFGDHAELREALLARRNLPAPVRHELVSAAARSLSAFVTGCSWLAPERAMRVTRESCERAALTIAGTCGGDGPSALIAHLRVSGLLTAGFALRCLLSGQRGLFETILAELSGLNPIRVAGLMRQARGAGFAALYTRAGMPGALLPAFRAALAATGDLPAGAYDGAAGAALSLAVIERVIGECEAVNTGDLDKTLAQLRRLEAEAAREQSREIAEDMRRPDAPAAPVLVIDTEALSGALLEAEHVAPEAELAVAA